MLGENTFGHSPPAMRRYGRWLAYLFEAFLTIAMLTGCASSSGIECKPGSVIAFGDSITFGAGIPPSESYPAQLGTLINESVCNAGINGDRVDSALKRLRPDVLRFKPTTVIVLIGVNDAGFFGDPTGTEKFSQALATIITRVRSSGATPILCSLLPIDAELLVKEWGQPDLWPVYDQLVRTVAAEKEVPFVDLAVALNGRLDLLPDGLHPGPAGSAVIASAVAKTLVSEGLATPAPR